MYKNREIRKWEVVRLKIMYFLIFLFFQLLSFSSISAITPQEILEKVDEIKAPAKTFIFNIKAFIKNSEEPETELSVRVKDAKKSLVIYKSPPGNKGRVLLMVEDNMWIYIPGTRNPIRISPQQEMMNRISNADIARVVYNLDYNVFSSSEEDNLEGKEILKLVLVAKTKGAAYKSITLWVEKANFKPVKTEFFAISGKLIKTAYYKKYEEILGKQRPTILEIHDEIKKREISIIEYSDIKIEDTPDIYFQKTYMERAK